MSPGIREDLRGIFDAALRRIDSAEAVRKALSTTEIPESGRLWVLGAGKAAAAMALGAHQALGSRIHGGLVIVSDGNGRAVPGIAIREAGHPIPDHRGLEATRELLRIADGATREDIVIWLVSGGGSALLVAPKPGTSLDDLRSMTDRLLRQGTPIEALNAARASHSQVKAGGLEDRIAPARILALAISDVSGDDVRIIASGPTRSAIVVAGVRDALQAADNEARRLGYRTSIAPDRLQGEAREVGEVLAKASLEPGECRIWGGETTVSVTGAGLGGRCQELALSACLHFEDDRVMLAAGTDGVDGPTDAAGAIVDRRTGRRTADARAHLGNNDAWTFLKATGDLLRTGPTGTNVADVVILARPRP